MSTKVIHIFKAKYGSKAEKSKKIQKLSTEPKSKGHFFIDMGKALRYNFSVNVDSGIASNAFP